MVQSMRVDRLKPTPTHTDKPHGLAKQDVSGCDNSSAAECVDPKQLVVLKGFLTSGK